MKLLLILAAIGVLLWLAWVGRRARHQEAIGEIRREFPRIARLRLVAACPGLDSVLDDRELRMVFDWMLLRLYGRTRASNFEELMRWSLKHGQAETTALTADVSREAIERLSRPVLAVIDTCQGRELAAVLVDQALTEAGRRIRPSLGR